MSVELEGPHGLPQVNVPPQPSGIVPHVFAWAGQVVGTHEGAAATFNVALAVPLYLAEIVATTDPACSAVVVAVNVATSLPDGMTIEAGTETKLLSLDRATVAPPKGAGGFNVMVPVELPPPTTLVGFIVTDATAGVGVPHWPGTPLPPQVSPKLQPQLIVAPQPSGVGPHDGPPEHEIGTQPAVTVSGCVRGACPAAPEVALISTTAVLGTELAP